MSLSFTEKPAPFAYFTVIAPVAAGSTGAEPIRLDEPVREYQLIKGVWEPQPISGRRAWPAGSEVRRPGRAAGELAHSVVPIAVGYLVAHYFALLLLEGQRTVALLADRLDTGPTGSARRRCASSTGVRRSVGQLPLLMLMLVYTMAGLLLLFAA